MDAAAGWYGKLPTLGDFASRRLGPGFVEPWDRWLSDGLAAWRADDPQWLQRYLDGPTWRFLLGDGALARRSPVLAGVLMPSVDAVGRYFPLTLAVPLPRMPADAAAWQALLHWLQRLEALAVDALHDDWSVARLEAALAELALPAQRPDAAASPPPWPDGLPTAPDAARAGGPRSWWWRDDAASGAPRLFTLDGLPPSPQFARLLAGDPAAAGSRHPIHDPGESP